MQCQNNRGTAATNAVPRSLAYASPQMVYGPRQFATLVSMNTPSARHPTQMEGMHNYCRLITQKMQIHTAHSPADR